jgi:hypothetical protein
MPLALLAMLYAPLRRGLDDVAWQIRARDAVDNAVSALRHRVVESRVRIERNAIGLVIFMLGGNAEAQDARRELVERVSRTSGVTPSIEVYAVADAAAFEAIEHALRKAPPAAPPPLASAPQRNEAARLASARALVREAVEGAWPRTSAGAPLAIELSLKGEPLQFYVVHLGAPIDRAAEEALERSLSDDLGTAVQLRSEALPSSALPLSDADDKDLMELAEMLPLARRLQIAVCLVEPETPKNALARRRHEQFRTALEELLSSQPRLARATGDAWSIRFGVDPCVSQASESR